MAKNLITIALLFIGLASFTFAFSATIDAVGDILLVAAGAR